MISALIWGAMIGTGSAQADQKKKATFSSVADQDMQRAISTRIYETALEDDSSKKIHVEAMTNLQSRVDDVFDSLAEGSLEPEPQEKAPKMVSKKKQVYEVKDPQMTLYPVSSPDVLAELNFKSSK